MSTLWALVLIPAAASVLALAVRNDPLRRIFLPVTCATHLVLTGSLWIRRSSGDAGEWLTVDEPGLLFLTIASVLFLAASIGAIRYLGQESERTKAMPEQSGSHLPESVFTACLLFFLCSVTFVCVCTHFGLIWIGVEATTLASAPLIIFHRNSRSLEAMWKYLLICSVGIALALMGNLLLAVSVQFNPDGGDIALNLPDLLRVAPTMNIPWLKAAFVFLLVGYGTKMGLAPMHTWLPDAHSESPSLVSALLSAVLLNCAFLPILRVFTLCVAAGEAAFAQELLVVLGLASLAVAAAFILRQSDYKRMLAYSSVEHMGLLALGVGLGGSAVFGALFHSVNHSLAKGALFLIAGNILAARRTKQANAVTGLFQTQRGSATLWVAGFLAITAMPPFGMFFSEWILLREAFAQDRFWLAGICLALLAIIFLGMASIMLRMVMGTPSGEGGRRSEPMSEVFPAWILLLLALLVGVSLPPPLRELLESATRTLSGVGP